MLYTETQNQIKNLEKEIADKKIWGSFDQEIVSQLADAGVPLHFHKVGTKLFKEEWEQEYALSVINRGKDGVYFVVAGEDALPGEVPAPSGGL